MKCIIWDCQPLIQKACLGRPLLWFRPSIQCHWRERKQVVKTWHHGKKMKRSHEKGKWVTMYGLENVWEYSCDKKWIKNKGWSKESITQIRCQSREKKASSHGIQGRQDEQRLLDASVTSIIKKEAYWSVSELREHDTQRRWHRNSSKWESCPGEEIRTSWFEDNNKQTTTASSCSVDTTTHSCEKKSTSWLFSWPLVLQ